MTKQKISITLDREIIMLIENLLNGARFRNRSHIIEYSVKKFIDELGRLENEKNLVAREGCEKCSRA